MKKIILLGFLFSYNNPLSAQQQFSGWLAAFNTVKVGKKTSVHSDIQWRSADELQFTQTFLARAGLNYHLRKNSTVTGGYAFIHNYRNMAGVDGYVSEHRIWEQFLFNHRQSRFNISHRLRIEQRFIEKTIIENNHLKSNGTASANRLRYFVRGIMPFIQESDPITIPPFNKGFFAALQNEVFLNFGNKANVNGKTFDQNRLYVAVGYRFSKSFDIETGYMNQYINGRITDVNNHVVQLASYIRL